MRITLSEDEVLEACTEWLRSRHGITADSGEVVTQNVQFGQVEIVFDDVNGTPPPVPTGPYR